jgi:spore coat polysaccharide biosynthesis protein SpsF
MIVILITARLGSTRLPRKHLLLVNGKPILQHLIDAINREFLHEIDAGFVSVVIATSERPENREFKDRLTACEVFFGSDGNIPLRHAQAAEAYVAQGIISVDGDDILCSPRAMRSVFWKLQEGEELVKTEGLPLGMNASGYSTALLRRALGAFEKSELLETGWGRVFEAMTPFVIRFECESTEDLRFTLDYDEDFKFFSTLLHDPEVATGMLDESGIVKLVRSRGLNLITRPVVDRYWDNFYSNIESEKGRKEL